MAGRAPKGLGSEGRALWRAIIAEVPAGCELTAKERHALSRAARCADEIGMLERAIDEAGALVEGSRGQLVANKAFVELRALRRTEAALLAMISLEDPDAVSPAQARGRRAARLRQNRLRAV